MASSEPGDVAEPAPPHYWSNRMYPDVEALYDAAEDGWRKCCLDAATVKSVCGAPCVTSTVIT
jgi:hypothetical protein